MSYSKTTNAVFNFSCRLTFRKSDVSKVDGYVSLYVGVHISAKNMKPQRRLFPLNLRWPAEKVDRDEGVLRARSRGDVDVNDYNMIILSERASMNEIAKRFRLQNRFLTVDLLMRELHYLDATRSVVAFMKKRRAELYKRKDIAEQTYKNYLSTINRIVEFDPLLSFEMLNEHLAREFVAFLKKQGNSHNTIWSRMRDLRSFARAAQDEHGIYIEKSFFDYRNRDATKEATYLFREEVSALMNLMDGAVLSKTEYNVLRAFLFCCFTGFRISDLYNSEYSWMTSDNFLRFTMVKNGQRKPKTITIPLIPLAKKLIQNDRGVFFDLPTTQEYNRTLKDLAGMASIVKVLTSHVARHTFGYLFMTATGDIYTLKKILGHSKISTTEKYAHVDDDDNFEKAMRIQDSFGKLNIG